jgi:hydrogenase nickel incorporation protein HypB
MCDTCGCGQSDISYSILKPGDEIYHQKDDDSYHNHHHYHNDENGHHSHKIDITQDVLHKNNLIAERNRGYLGAKKTLALNLVSSPGSGKTSIIERSIVDLGKEMNFFVIEGDQQTSLDAERIQNAGCRVIQINTGNGCHLDAQMVNKAIEELQIADGSVLIIENVGNLICPSLFDLGESFRVVIISVTEGDDKPLKYPTMFHTSNICIINKTDLLPYVDFNVNKCKDYALRINHNLQFLEMSAKSGEGLENWYDWLRVEYKRVSQHPKP